MDTGNSLCDPVTGRAVHLVRYQLLKPCLDPEAGRIIEQFYGNISGIKKIRREQADISGIGFRIIPYHAIGTEKGVLLGITADKLVFSDQGRKYIEEGCVIVPYPGDPFGEQGYEVILHPDILRK